MNHGSQSKSTDGPKGGLGCVFLERLQCLQWSSPTAAGCSGVVQL